MRMRELTEKRGGATLVNSVIDHSLGLSSTSCLSHHTQSLGLDINMSLHHFYIVMSLGHFVT